MLKMIAGPFKVGPIAPSRYVLSITPPPPPSVPRATIPDRHDDIAAVALELFLEATLARPNDQSVRRFLELTGLPLSHLVVAMLLVFRAGKQAPPGGPCPRPEQVYPGTLAAIAYILVARKYWDDDGELTTGECAKQKWIQMGTLREINARERMTLAALGYRLHVSGAVYAASLAVMADVADGRISRGTARDVLGELSVLPGV